MADEKLFFRGGPTDGQVQLLMAAFGTPKVGALITHEDVEATVGQQRTQHRYKSIVRAWRRTLLDKHNVDMGAVAGIGWKALRDDERIDAGIKGNRAGVRKIVRSVRRSDAVVTEDLVLVQKQMIQRRLGIAMQAEYAAATKALVAIPPPSMQNPKPKPPGAQEPQE